MSRILIVDDDERSRGLMDALLAAEGYQLSFASSGAEAIRKALDDVPDLILLDVMMPGIDGFEVCRHLRLDPLLGDVPVLLISGMESREARLRGIEAGADDMIGKPFDTLELRARVRNITGLNRYRKLFSERTAHERERIERDYAFTATLEGWARGLELRGLEPDGHSARVVSLTMRIGREMGIEGEERRALQWGALLHDVGKYALPDGILLKNGPLNPSEWRMVRQHPQWAFDLFSSVTVLRSALAIPHGHHERWDGSGYPQGLKGEDIPLPARVFAVVDVWDTVCSDRPYRKAWAPARAAAYLREQAGVLFDPEVVRVLLALPDIAEAISGRGADGRSAGRRWWRRPRPARRRAPSPRDLSLSSRGARTHFAAAVALTSVIPVLALGCVASAGLLASGFPWRPLLPAALIVVAMMVLGYGMLARYPASIVRLRRQLESLAEGDVPLRLALAGDEDDLSAIEKSMRRIVAQTQERIQKMEALTESLVEAERQRVAIEGLGAACHHLGQPATTLTVALDLIREAGAAAENTPMMTELRQSVSDISAILEKLQRMASYRSESYPALETTPSQTVDGSILQVS